VRIAIFSDIHGNLPALEAFVDQTARDVDAYVCLGDIVNYGPWNDECLELVFSLPHIVVLEGNHERLFLGEEDISHEISLVQDFYRHSIARFTRIDLIRGLPLEYEIGGFTCTHTIQNKRIYQDTSIEIDRNYVIGHTHHAFDITCFEHRIVNCGSIGQNRRDVSLSSYALMDLDFGSISLKEFPYDSGKLITELERRGYGRNCLDYYRSKLPGRGAPAVFSKSAKTK
jgi:predicted phosphodiesterase